ncbi:PEP/pyruvate-binding domain-containing protein [Streptomyces sp. L7]
MNVNEIGELRDDEILVCPVTAPSWGPVFGKIKPPSPTSAARCPTRRDRRPRVRYAGRGRNRRRHPRHLHRADDPGGRRPGRGDGLSTRGLEMPGRITATGRTPGRRPRPVVPFTDLGRGDIMIAGGKGAALGELTSAGIGVPEGFVITTHMFRATLDAVDPDSALVDRVAALDGDDLATITRVCAEARDRLGTAPLPTGLVDAVGEYYRRLCEIAGTADLPVAVRSSATSEDSAEASFAGQQDTFLWVRGVEEVLTAVQRCWASVYSVDSVTYRRRKNLPEDGLAMGVVVQRMVDARSSGVMFTRSPLTGDRSVIAIDASWGLGSAVVGGEVTPDSFLVNKITREVVRSTVATKTVRHVPDPAGGVHVEPVPADLQGTPAVDESELLALAEVARRIERHYGCPQDIEWAISASAPAGANLFLLQSRPETVWAARRVRLGGSPCRGTNGEGVPPRGRPTRCGRDQAHQARRPIGGDR